MIEEGLRSWLLADPTIAGVVGMRIYPEMLPQQPEYPAITYQRVSEVPQFDLTGPKGYEQPRIQIDVWAQSYASAKGLARSLRARCNVVHVTMGAVPVDWCRFVAEQDGGTDPDLGVRRIIIDLMIAHR